MCRLLGVRANQAVDLEFSMLAAPKTPQASGAFRGLANNNPDGWGMGWYDRGRPRVFKEPISALESEVFPRLAAEEFSDIFLCHVRKRTEGEVNYRNCHPFRHDKWLFAHNGRIEPIDPLRAKLSVPYAKEIQGETDSEVFFYWILQNIDRCEGDAVAGIRTAVLGLPEYTGLNFLLSDGERLFAYRQAKSEVDYYSLYYLVRGRGKPGPEDMRSKEIGSFIHSRRLGEEKAVLVSSERLTDEDWRPIELGYLLVAGPKVEPRLIAVQPREASPAENSIG